MIRDRRLLLTAATAALLSLAEASALKPRCSGQAQCCYDEWQSFYSKKSVYEQPTVTYVDWVVSTVYSTNTAQVPVTTLCDGFPRYMKPLKSTSYTVKITPTPGVKSTQYIYNYYTKPEPTCIISPQDCAPFWASYSSQSSAWEADPTDNPSPSQTIPCHTYVPCPTQDFDDGGQVCKLYAGDVKIYYWPVSTTGDFCAATPTILAPPPGTKSTVIKGTTFISPSVYLEIASASARRHNGPYTFTDCGYTRTSIFLSFPSAAALSTRAYKPGTASNTKPWNLVDMGTPAPASNYFFGTKTVCTTTGCPTLEVTPYHTMDVPTALMTADPSWKYCTPRSEGFFGEETYIPLENVPANWPKPTATATKKH